MEETIESLKSYLTDLKTARLDIVKGGAVKTVRKGDFTVAYSSLSELSKEIRTTEEKISLLELNQ